MEPLCVVTTYYPLCGPAWHGHGDSPDRRANRKKTMAKEKKSKISYFHANFTSTVSVSLVLLLLGVVAFVGLTARSFSDSLRENIGFNVILKGDVGEADVNRMTAYLRTAPYVSDMKYISKDEALQSWQKETGENLIELFGVNPLSAEYEVYVRPAYSNVDSLDVIERQIMSQPCVEEVSMHKAEVDTINRNLQLGALVLLAIALLLLVISLVLINNTVHLTIYSRRFLIHTMKLVGAKPGFIRKPLVVSSMLNGLIASVVAMGLLTFGYFSFQRVVGISLPFTPVDVCFVFAGLLVAGVLICGFAAFAAAGKYIRLNYDELFKR